MSFRKDFLYGFATAAAQVEGGGAVTEKLSGRGDSVSLAWLLAVCINVRFGMNSAVYLETSLMGPMFVRRVIICLASKKMSLVSSVVYLLDSD
jgi:hypothetical protein